MFTGIIETLGEIVSIHLEAGNAEFVVKADFCPELILGQSIAHNGVCLTVTKLDFEKKQFTVVAVEETLKVTQLGKLAAGDVVNLERCMPAGGRFDGHIVQGHVDTTALCFKIEHPEGSTKFYFKHENREDFVTVKKGSICINGTSLTVVDSEEDWFSVVIIPYTLQNTNFRNLKEGDLVNLEFDIIGKYLLKMSKR